jgi:hypothetical protein
MSRKFKHYENLTRVTGTLHEDPCTSIIISRSVLLRMSNLSGRFMEKIKTHILFSITFLRKSRRLRDNIKNTLAPARPQKIIWRMLIACCIPKATDTQSEYVIILFLPQQLFRMHARMLRSTYCLP